MQIEVLFNIQSHSQVVVFFVCVKGVLLSFCSSVTWPVIQQCVCCFKQHHRKVPDSVKLNGTHPLAVLNVSGPTLLTALQVQHQYSSLIITRETAAWSILHPGLYRAARPSPCQANRRKSKKKKLMIIRNQENQDFLCLNVSVSLMRRRCGHTIYYSTVLTPLLTSHNPLMDFIIQLISLINKQLYSGPLSGLEKT